MPLAQSPHELSQAERHFRDLAEHVDSVFWVISPDLRLVYLSPAVERIWGREAATLLGDLDRFLATTHPDDRSNLAGWLQRGLERMQKSSAEYRIVRPDGDEVWIRTRAFPVLDPEGVPARLAGLSDDVTEEHHAQRELQETSRRLTRTFASLQDAVFVVESGTRRILECNESAERMFGYARQELLSSTTRILHLDDESYEAFGHRSEAILEGMGVAQLEWEMRRKDGSTFESCYTVSTLDPEGDMGGGVVSVVRDLSAERKLERQLRQGQRLEAVGRLAGGVAHDFNNLLTVIRGHSQMVIEDLPETSALRGDMRQILNEVERATQLTRQLLAFGRKQVLDERVRKLGEVVAESASALRRLVPPEVSLRLESDGGRYLVRVDAAQLRQALVNLVLNAVQAIEGEGTVTVSLDEVGLSGQDVEELSWVAEPGPYARLTVTDDGSGIPAHVRDRIFDPFFTTKTSGQGTGLGLPTVFGIVKQSGGHILVHSNPGEGATFRILLPLVEGEEPEPPRDPASRRTGSLGGLETVLLVEDEEPVRDVIARGLERAGYAVIVAADGADAIELLRAKGPGQVDIAVSDVVMPTMGGAEFVRRLREVDSSAPVILMSGYSEEDLDVSLREARATFLQKPFSPDDIVQRVREALDGLNPRESPATPG